LREKRFVAWLEKKEDAEGFSVRDLFVWFWSEYKAVVPKGFVRVLGKLAEIRDSGIPIYFFVGNHDLCGRLFQRNILCYHDNQEFYLGINIPHWSRRRQRPMMGLQTNESVYQSFFLNGLDFTLILEYVWQYLSVKK
jgi:hypothetical protein